MLFKMGDVAAVFAMNDQAPGTGHRGDDGVAQSGIAATGGLKGQVVNAREGNAWWARGF